VIRERLAETRLPKTRCPHASQFSTLIYLTPFFIDMDDTDVIVTFQTFVGVFSDFLIVAIHTILYERDIYPRDSFLSAKKYNYSVRQSRHPKVCQWITDAVAAVQTELLKGTVDRVALVIYSAQDTPLERFVFDLSRFPFVPKEYHFTPMSRTTDDGETVAVLPRVDLEEQMRATMSRLSSCGSTLKPLPESCTFTIAIELRDNTSPPIGHPQPWIPAQPDLRNTNPDAAKKNSRTMPIRAVSAGDMVFETWIEEAKAKLDPA
jgi:mitotic spindle assembly checkpoint protein MAD2B